MKVLSLKQPYADLIVNGEKRIELRKWNTKFRGEFLIHASKGIDKEECKIRNIDLSKFVAGAIIGKVTIVDVKKYNTIEEILKDKKDFHIHFQAERWFVIPMYGFKLENPIKFDKPIFCKGQLGFWDFNMKVK